jgi:hypothetical protein
MSGAILTAVIAGWHGRSDNSLIVQQLSFHDIGRARWPASCEVMPLMAEANYLGPYRQEYRQQTTHGSSRRRHSPGGQALKGRNMMKLKWTLFAALGLAAVFAAGCASSGAGAEEAQHPHHLGDDIGQFNISAVNRV